jgi:flagellar hook-associated protein 3 FlgL
MSSISLGDLAQNYMLQRRGSALRTEMSRLNEELASGRVADVKQILSGNMNYLTDLESSISHMRGYKVSSTEAAQFTGAMQTALELVGSTSSDLGNNLLTVTASSLDIVAKQTTVEAREQLNTIVATLNTDFAGRSLFAGTAFEQAPLASADDLLDQLRTVMTGVVGAPAKLAAVDAWFSDPAGFDATIYQGSAEAMSPFRLSEHENVAVDVRANNDAIKAVLRNVAVAALADDPALGINATERSTLLISAGEGLLSNAESYTAMRANIGFVEERIDDISTRNAVEMTSLEYAKGELLAADPYETATRLEEVQFQLQSLYTVTVRSSQLSLVNFL